MSVTTRLALVGLGKIAKDQHIPALADNETFELGATVDPREDGIAGVNHYRSFQEFLDTEDGIDAIALCTPPQVRFNLARQALAAGFHVLLEKVPTVGAAEMRALCQFAEHSRGILFSAWHSRFAHAVHDAKSWLSGQNLRSVNIIWKEDVRIWHPGQRWIWEIGGPGVFDPGINALSVLTEILPDDVFVSSAKLFVPANQKTPIAAHISMRSCRGTPVYMELDWLYEGPPKWDIIVETDAERMTLSDGGAKLTIGGRVVSEGPDREYFGVYRRFGELIASSRTEVDERPLLHVLDAFYLGKKIATAAFTE